MGNHHTCPVKIPILRKLSFAIKKVVKKDVGVVHNNNSYTSEVIVLKHTFAKFDLVICKKKWSK